jgi:hypothetical protein
MAKIRTVSKVFPSHHLRKQQPTFFADKIRRSLAGETEDVKHYTIRSGKSIKNGEVIHLKQWSGRPYHSPQEMLVESIQVHTLNIKALFSSVKHDSGIFRMDIRDLYVFDDDAYYIASLSGHHYTFFKDERGNNNHFFLNTDPINQLCQNDGLNLFDFHNWFCPIGKTVEFEGQIICWNTDNSIFYAKRHHISELAF